MLIRFTGKNADGKARVMYLNPAQIACITPNHTENSGYLLLSNEHFHYCDPEEAQRLIDVINAPAEPDDNFNTMTVRMQKDGGEYDDRFHRAVKAFWREMDPSATPAAPTPSPEPVVMRTNLLSMTRDRTKNSGSPFWRCGTEEGFMVNVFKHDDPLKDSFHLFDHAGYAPEMLNMSYGDTINWTLNSIYIEIQQNGNFWNVVRVFDRPPGAMPDEPEQADDESEWDDENA
jgi:hypothetical protein